MFLVLEGADGCGKTTLCTALAKRLEATAFATPLKGHIKLRGEVGKNASAGEHYRFYRNSVHAASREIEALLRSNGKVVCDRYWLTTYTYHKIMGVKVQKKDFQSIVVPTLTVILALNHEVQIERMLRRGMSVEDRRVFGKQQEIANTLLRDAVRFNIPFILIDTQRFSPEACAELVVKAMKF